MAPYPVVPAVTGGSRLILGRARALTAAGHRVRLHSLVRFTQTPALRALSPGLEVRFYRARWAAPWLAAAGMQAVPEFVPALGFQTGSALLHRNLFDPDFDIYQFAHPWFPRLMRRMPRGRRVLATQNFELSYFRSRIEASARPQYYANLLRRLEGDAIEAADRVIVLAHDDADLFAGHYGVSPEKMCCIPPMVTPITAVTTSATRTESRIALGIEDRYAILYAGSDQPANVQSLSRFLNEIWPRVLEEVPEATLLVAGSVGDRFGHVSRTPDIIFSGGIPDLGPWFCAADVAIYPRDDSSGVITRLLEYLAHRLPVVTTPAGARGLSHLKSGMVVSDVEDFPAAISRLPRFRDTTTAMLHSFHGEHAILGRLLELYRELLE